MAKVKVTDNGYSIESLYKWDTSQVLEIYGMTLPVVPQVHFAHKGAQYAIVREATMDASGVIQAAIPDSLLQSSANLCAYVCTQQGDEFKTHCKIVIPVITRAKPSDYAPDEENYVYMLANVQTEAFTLDPGAAATVEKVVRDGKLTLRFGVPRGLDGEDLLTADLNEVYSRMALKGDNLEFDPDEKKLYLTSDGVRVSDGITIVTSGGGGGGGSTNNAVISLQNDAGWIYKTVSAGASCPITFTWSSLENGMETGPGVLKITNNGAQKYLAATEQGTITMDMAPYLSAGSNIIKVNVTDTYGNGRTITFNVTAVALSLASAFDNTVPYTGAFNYIYTPTGAAAKTMHFLVDGKEIATATVTASGRQQTQAIPAQSHGSHTLEVYFTAEVDGVEVPSNRLYYDLICLEDGNTAPIIASDFNGKTAEQFDSIVIPFRVYAPGSMTAPVTLAANGVEVNTLTVDRTMQTWTYRADGAGALRLTITCGSTVKPFDLTITESKVNVEAETESLALYLSSYGRSNAEDNPGQWQSGDVAAEFTGFNFVSDGWIADADGITALRIGGDARLTIPLQVFAQDFRSTGKTIELEFATRDILNYDAVILSCFSGDRGLQLTAQKALLKSEQSEISTQYKEDERVRLAFVVEKRSAHRLLQVYINGILSGVTQYPDDDDFSQSNAVGISVGSSDCTIDLYGIRVYDNDLTRYQVLDNWIADAQLGAVKNERWKHNDVFDQYGQIVIGQLPQDLPYLVIQSARLPVTEIDEITVGGYYVDPTDSKKGFTFENAVAKIQGTSSAGYARKNYKLKFKGGFTNGGVTSPTYQLGEGSVPTATFTFKADVASSEGANNVELVKLYNDICPYKTPAQVADPTVRQGIDGYPIVIFQDDGENVTFIGKYNFNHDKGTPEVFGFDSNDESWEIRNNTSDRVVWKNDDFSGTDWLNDFEGRHPDKNTNAANLAALAAWIKSTDTTAAGLTDEEKAARLAKFKDELADWMNVDSTLFYYLFTELFLMVDSRAKNAFPTRYDGGVWCWLPYDMDTALGINNEGALTFGYHLEDTDHTATGADVYNGQQSVLWNNVRLCFADELMAMYQKLRSDKLLTYEDVVARFENHQAKWPEAIFNEDAYYKYLQPLFESNTASYLGMLQGSKAEQRKWWLYNRFRYMDAKYNAGDALADFITVRGYAKNDLTVTPYADIYAAIKYGSYLERKRALRGSSYLLECPLDNVNDTETYIYSASQLAAVEGLDGYMVGYADFSMATKLQALKLGDGAADYSNPNLIELYLGNNTLLKTLDVRNCPNLGAGANKEGHVQQSVDLSGCTNIEHVYFDGTALKGVTLPVGGIIKTLHLPGTVTNLTVRNQGAITDFVLPAYGNITTLRLENVSAAIPAYAILQAMPENSRVRLIGFDWSFDTAADILTFYDRLDTMRGLDENGNNMDKAQLSGTIRVNSITGAQLSEMQSRYPDIKVIYQSIVSYLYFYNEDGSSVLQIVECKDGADGAYSGSTPTKASTAQYAYSFAGWSRTIGGAVDPNAMKNVTADRSLYAAFTATVRTYTVRFYNGSTLLQTVNNVPYGGSATYTGDDPTDDSGNPFQGWKPEPTNITGDTDCYASFVDTSIAQWEALFASMDAGTYATDYAIGDTIPLNLGSEGVINMQIAAFDADDLADGSGKAKITWISKELLATTHRWNPALVTNDDGTYQEGTGGIGGWEKCELKAYMSEAIAPLIPAQIVQRIKPVIKYTRVFDASGTSTKNAVLHLDLWSPSLREMGGTFDETSGVRYTALFSGNESRKKTKQQGTDCGYYLRSVPAKDLARTIDNGGAVNSTSTQNNYGVCLGFCIN